MRITSRLTGGFRFESEVRGHTLVVDQTVDAGGTNDGPLPPELMVISLGTCVGIYAVFYCRKHGISTEGMTIHADWEKALNPARIGKIDVTIEMPEGVSPDQQEAFLVNVEKCLVHNSFKQPPEISMKLGFMKG